MKKSSLILALAASSLVLEASGNSLYANEYVVLVEQMKFSAIPVEAKIGDVIVWKNNDLFRHTATAKDASFDVDLPAGEEARTTLKSSGTIEFYCRFHTGMTGKLNVSP